MIKFLEDYESAFLNIEYVLRHKRLSGDHDCPDLYTDEGKQRLFVQNFSVPDLTADLIDSVESTTESWDAMIDSLRRRLANHSAHSKTVAKRNPHLSTIDDFLELHAPSLRTFSSPSVSPTFTLTEDMVASPAFINALSSDWRIGYKL